MSDRRKTVQTAQKSGIVEITETHSFEANMTPPNIRKEVVVVESKKHRTESNANDPMGFNTEVMMDSEEEENAAKQQTGSENKMVPKKCVRGGCP